MSYKCYISERNQMVYDMRVVEKRTFASIAEELGVCIERIRQIVAKVERCKLHKERRDAAPRGSLGSMRLTVRLENALLNENETRTVDLLDFLSRIPCREMRRWPNVGKRSINEFAEEAIKIVGKDAVMRWLNAGENQNGQ